MHILSVFTVILLSVCTALAVDYVNQQSYNDGTYAYLNYWPMSAAPTPQNKAAYARAAFEEMVRKGDASGIDPPNAMSVAWWPNRSGVGGTLILQSSIKGGFQNEETRNFINTCNLGGHRYNGMCGEIANMALAKSLMDQGRIDSNSQVRWTVYGVTNPRSGETGWMAPCGEQHGRPGCQGYVDALARHAGGGGTCIMKREPEPLILKPALKPKPNVPKQKPDVPISSDSPDTPDTPVRMGGEKSTNNEPATDNSDDPVRLGAEKSPDDKPATDKPDANSNKGFEKGAICKLPVRKTGPPKTGADIPDPSALTNFMPPPPADNNNSPKLKIRGAGWD